MEVARNYIRALGRGVAVCARSASLIIWAGTVSLPVPVDSVRPIASRTGFSGACDGRVSPGCFSTGMDFPRQAWTHSTVIAPPLQFPPSGDLLAGSTCTHFPFRAQWGDFYPSLGSVGSGRGLKLDRGNGGVCSSTRDRQGIRTPGTWPAAPKCAPVLGKFED